MSLAPSPVRRLKEIVKASLLKDLEVMGYLETRSDRISTNRYLDVGEQDIPICLITAVDEDIKRLDQDYSERSDLSMIVEFHGFPNEAINFDDFTFHVRNLLSSMQVRTLLGKAFESIRVVKITYNRTTLGTKNIQQVSLEVRTLYDSEIDYQFDNADQMENLEVKIN